MKEHDSMESAFRLILSNATGLSLDALTKDTHFSRTHVRAAKALRELLDTFADVRKRPVGLIVNDVIGDGYFEDHRSCDVTVGPVVVWGLCPHHLLPVEFKCVLRYSPDEHVVGLSKIPRILDYFSKAGLTQEAFTQAVVTGLMISKVKPNGVAMYAVGRHTCMEARGVCSDGKTETHYAEGRFQEDSMLMDRFMADVNKYLVPAR